MAILCALPFPQVHQRARVGGSRGPGGGLSTRSLPIPFLTLVLSSSHPFSTRGARGPQLDLTSSIYLGADLVNPRARGQKVDGEGGPLVNRFLQPPVRSGRHSPRTASTQDGVRPALPPAPDFLLPGAPWQPSTLLPSGSFCALEGAPLPSLSLPGRGLCERLDGMVGSWHYLVSSLLIWVLEQPGKEAGLAWEPKTAASEQSLKRTGRVCLGTRGRVGSILLEN